MHYYMSTVFASPPTPTPPRLLRFGSLGIGLQYCCVCFDVVYDPVRAWRHRSNYCRVGYPVPQPDCRPYRGRYANHTTTTLLGVR